MVSTTVDFYRKIPRDLTEASLSGARLSIVAALAMVFLFGLELSNYLAVNISTSVIVDKSSDGNFLNIDFNISFQFLAVNFYAPWCYWSSRLKPSWEKATDITRKRYDPQTDGRILLGSFGCTKEPTLCKRDDHGKHEHESYYGDRDTESLVKMVEGLLKPIKKEDQNLTLDGKSDNAASNIKKAPLSGGCRIEGYLRAKKVPGELVISAHSGAHSFDASHMNMSHFVTHFSFGTMVSERLWTDMKRLLPYLGQSHDRLDGKWFINQRKFDANVTVISRRSGQEHSLIEEYEYTANSNVAHSYDLPVAKFHFELSPMQVLKTENPKSFSHFITNVCAIIGGVFTVAGILDSIFQRTVKLVKKVELGTHI